MWKVRLRLVLCIVGLVWVASCGSGPGTAPVVVTPPSSGIVELVIADPDVFVGSYHPIEVRIDAASGLTVEDLTFTIPSGPSGGEVSLSNERGATGPPAVMLLVGPQTGSYELVASETATGTELDRLAFKTTTRWSTGSDGPSVWFTGTPAGMPGGSAWGGGPGSPQNLDVHPARGTQRVAIVLIDTTSQRFTPAEVTETRTRYMDHTINGVTVDGRLHSVARYYSEVSYGNLTITARAFGPFSLDDTFRSYIGTDGIPLEHYWAACAEAADGGIDYSEFDSIVWVSRDDETTDPAAVRRAGAYGSILKWGPFKTDDGDLNLAMISMPSTFGMGGGVRPVSDVLSHELGHNLGLGDMYDPIVMQDAPATDQRNLGAWGMMHADWFMPHFSAAHRMKLGWIESGWIRNIDFSRAGAHVDEVVTLEAIERGEPTAALHNVLEIRIADGRNYYFEYRNPQTGQIGDRELPRPNSVVGVDAVTGPFPFARPFLLLLKHDVDGDGSVMQTGEDYQEVDATDITFPTDFRVDVTSIAAEVATLRVRYDVLGKPDPSIRPWPSGPDRQYQSPDIEVRNARNAVDPSLFNVPWAEHPNTIVARIKNRGTLNAENVVATFYIKGLTTGGATEVLRGSDTQTIAPDATVEFSVPWTPPREGHFCVVVRIDPYVTPSAGVAEMTTLNNVAQSNYARFISATASPATRESTAVIVGNPYAKRARIYLVCAQTNPYYRTYVEHRWVTLDPGELRRVNVMFEHAGALPSLGGEQGGPPPKPSEHNTVLIRAAVEDPRSLPAETAHLWDGVQVRVDTGRATKIDVVGDTAGVVSGTVRTVDDGEEVDGGQVIVSYEGPKATGRVGHQVVPLQSGTFLTEVPEDWTAIHVTYMPSAGLAESDASTTR